MAKITVRHSVAQAYGLLFGRPLTIVGLTWLPAVFYGLGASYLITRMIGAMAVAVPSANGLLGQYAFFYFVALLAATAFFGALIAVPLTREALGLREDFAAAHLVLGAREARLFLALLRHYAILVAGLVALALGAGVAISQGARLAPQMGLAAGWLGIPLETWLNSVAGALAVIFFSVCSVRFGFFLDAVAAVEERVTLRRAAHLARGNFWSVTAVSLIVGVPIAALALACEMTFAGLGSSGLGLAPADAGPFAAILTVGLVALHALLAGASAGAYAEMAEAAMQGAGAEESAPQHARQPVRAYADAGHHEHGQGGYQAEAAEGPVTMMEIATPEASTLDWMAPPPDAHFGSDPHDAQPHEAMEAAAPPAAVEPLAEAVAQVEEAPAALPAHAETAAVAPEAAESALQEAAHAADTDAASHESEAVGFDGHPVAVPDHAQNAEFPAPPLDPAGVIASAMQAQAGFHTSE